MTTPLSKRVERLTLTTTAAGSRRQIIVALLPGDLIEFREKGCRKRWVLPIGAAMWAAAKAEHKGSK